MDLRIYLYNKPVSDVKALRTEVFAGELGLEEVMDSIDEHATHILIYDGGTAIATGRLYSDNEEKFVIGSVCVKKDYRGKKLGKRVLSALEEDARKSGGSDVSARVPDTVQGFFEKAGYTAADTQPDNAQVVMTKKIRK